MQVNLAKTAGFCFGVDRAVNLVYDLLAKGKKVCTLGPIIHNQQLVDDLISKGVKITTRSSSILSSSRRLRGRARSHARPFRRRSRRSLRSRSIAATASRRACALSIRPMRSLPMPLQPLIAR